MEKLKNSQDATLERKQRKNSVLLDQAFDTIRSEHTSSQSLRSGMAASSGIAFADGNPKAKIKLASKRDRVSSPEKVSKRSKLAGSSDSLAPVLSSPKKLLVLPKQDREQTSPASGDDSSVIAPPPLQSSESSVSSLPDIVPPLIEAPPRSSERSSSPIPDYVDEAEPGSLLEREQQEAAEKAAASNSGDSTDSESEYRSSEHGSSDEYY